MVTQTRRSGSAIICGACEHALWRVVHCEAGSQFVDFKCICANCGCEPDIKAMSDLCYYNSTVLYFDPKKLVAIHTFCARCLKEDRNLSSIVSTRAKSEDWKKLVFQGSSTEFENSTGFYHTLLCNECSQRTDLKNWIAHEFKLRLDSLVLK